MRSLPNYFPNYVFPGYFFFFQGSGSGGRQPTVLTSTIEIMAGEPSVAHSTIELMPGEPSANHCELVGI